MTMTRMGGSPRGSGGGAGLAPPLPIRRARGSGIDTAGPAGRLSRPAAGGYHPFPMTAPARTLPSKPLDRSIVDGPIPRAVWMLAWPTMLQNLIGGLQGMVDHALVGHFVGYAGNAAIGVAIQIFIVVIVFVMSVFSGMGVLVARFAGANQ